MMFEVVHCTSTSSTPSSSLINNVHVVFGLLLIGTLSCTLKLPDEKCALVTRNTLENKIVLQLKKFADVLFMDSTFKNIFKKACLILILTVFSRGRG